MEPKHSKQPLEKNPLLHALSTSFVPVKSFPAQSPALRKLLGSCRRGQAMPRAGTRPSRQLLHNTEAWQFHEFYLCRELQDGQQRAGKRLCREGQSWGCLSFPAEKPEEEPTHLERFLSMQGNRGRANSHRRVMSVDFSLKSLRGSQIKSTYKNRNLIIQKYFEAEICSDCCNSNSSNTRMINAASLEVTGKTNHLCYHTKRHFEKQDTAAKPSAASTLCLLTNNISFLNLCNLQSKMIF